MPEPPLLAQLMPFAGNFAPRGYALCAGQILPISQNIALFSLIGTLYGGNGQTTFALPDLRGRTPVHMGQGPGLSLYVQGEADGLEDVSLQASQLGTHNHTLPALAASATAASPSGAALAEAHGSGRGGAAFPINRYTSATSPATTLSPQSLTSSGQSGPHNNLQPYLVINWCIALQGIFPSRN